ncbi:DUF4214 domain-containing protein [Massilia sp. W12]|uniref:DUF4214 domain-containing protein n=1 Tax=Massilia sp. W12 TaxID=3126507 RepID=UPI0030CE4BDF
MKQKQYIVRRAAQLGVLSAVFALSACGGASPESQPGPKLAAKSVSLAAQSGTQLSDYQDAVQRIFVAYFGRPADTSGLPFFEQQLLNAGAPTTVQGINQAYLTNPNVKALIDFFGTSAESQALYPGTTEEFLTAVYQNLYNRAPDAGGLAYWSAKINSGELTRPNAAVSIMAGAQSTDIDIISKKTAVATSFTNSLDSAAKIEAYGGLSANATVRSMLNQVSNSTDLQAFQATLTATITSLVNSKLSTQAQSIVTARCTPCHSASPTISGFPAARIIKYDSASDIKNGASGIALTVSLQSMPQNNMTGMTDAERATIAAWFAAGAP